MAKKLLNNTGKIYLNLFHLNLFSVGVRHRHQNEYVLIPSQVKGDDTVECDSNLLSDIELDDDYLFAVLDYSDVKAHNQTPPKVIAILNTDEALDAYTDALEYTGLHYQVHRIVII